MLNKSPSITNLIKALSVLQGELKDSSKNAVNPHYKSKYSDLSEVLGNLRPLLAKHQLALSQFPSFENGIVSVTSLLAHASGEWIESTASAPATKQDVQGVGSSSRPAAHSADAPCHRSNEGIAVLGCSSRACHRFGVVGRGCGSDRD